MAHCLNSAPVTGRRLKNGCSLLINDILVLMSQTLQKRSALKLILRSLQPSGASVFIGFVAALVLVIINLLLQSVTVGTSLPGILDGQWSIAYTEHVVQPLTELLSNNTLNKLIVAGLWGAAGFLVYLGFEFAVHSMKNLRENKTNIRMARGNVLEHPAAESFWKPVIWRVSILILAIAFFVAAQPLISNALDATHAVLLSEHLLQDGLRVLLSILEWMVVFHGIVVLLRLYTMRTRLFGDDELY